MTDIDRKRLGHHSADRSQLEQAMRASAASFAAMPPLEQAKLYFKQRRSFARGQRSEHTTAEAIDAALEKQPEYVVLAALEAAEAQIAALERQLAEAQGKEGE